MKIIKLDKRFKYFREGHTHAIRFSGYFSHDAVAVETYLKKTYGSSDNRWCSWRGHKANSLHRPYYICAKNEAILLMAILSIESVTINK